MYILDGEKSVVSSQLATVEQVTRRRHREWTSRVESTEDRMASFMGKLINESIDRESSHILVRTESIAKPLKEMCHRISSRMQEEEMKSTDLLGKLEDVVNRLTYAMAELENQTIVQCQQTHWKDSMLLQKSKVMDSVRIEKSKTEKREGGLHNRWDTLAAKTTVEWARERAESKALLHFLEQQVQSVATVDERRTEDFIQRVQTLKQDIARERKERQRRDEEIMDLILQTQDMLQKQLLESLE